MKEYEPHYLDGQILVALVRDTFGPFRNLAQKDLPANIQFAGSLGEILGYRLLEEWNYARDVFVYETAKGKEQQAIHDFTNLKMKNNGIDWADRRDGKLELRWNKLNTMKKNLSERRDSGEISSLDHDRVRSYMEALHERAGIIPDSLFEESITYLDKLV